MTATSPPPPSIRSLQAPWAAVVRFLAWWRDELSDIAAARASRAHGWKVMLLRREGGCDIHLRARNRIEHIGTSLSPDDRVFHDLRRRVGRQRIAPAEIVLRLAPGEVVLTRLSAPTGLSLRSTNVTTPKRESDLIAIGVDVSLQGQTDGLRAFLHAIETGVPILFIETLAVRSVPAYQPMVRDITLRIRGYAGGKDAN